MSRTKEVSTSSRNCARTDHALGCLKQGANGRQAAEITLEARELAALTRRDRPAAQARVLDALGIPFLLHPTDRVLLVSRTAVEAALGGPDGGTMPQSKSLDFDVDLEGIRKHGKTSNSR